MALNPALAGSLRAALEPLFAPLLEEMRRYNTNFEKLLEGEQAIAFIRREYHVKGDLVTGDKIQDSVVNTGDIGAGARALIGNNNSWKEAISSMPCGESLKSQFAVLLEKVANDPALDEDDRHLARAKVEAVAQGLVAVETSPGVFRQALKDAGSWFGGTTSWVGKSLAGILKSEAAQKTLGTVAEAVTKVAIDGYLERF